MNLSNDEAVCMARRIIARASTTDNEWLQWEDFPNLGEHAFARLERAVDEFAADLARTADDHDRLQNIDSRYLIEQAQA